MPWFRLYSEMIHDRKLSRAARVLDYPMPFVVGVWVSILCMANDSPVRGRLMIGEDIPAGEDDIAHDIGLSLEDTRRFLDCFVNLSMLADDNGYSVSNWENRQFKSDNVNERVKKHRANKQKAKKRSEDSGSKQGETLPKRYSNVIEKEKETDTETDTEKEKTAAPQADAVFSFFEENLSTISQKNTEEFSDLIDTYGPDTVLRALSVAHESGKRSLGYAAGVLRNWQKKGPEPFFCQLRSTLSGICGGRAA